MGVTSKVVRVTQPAQAVQWASLMAADGTLTFDPYL